MAGKSWREVFKVHPAADVFPMLGDAELTDLAADITSNGLQEPVVMWSPDDNAEWLIDGRNRLAAMELAGVELQPWWRKTICVKDPTAVIISLNIRRRHLGAAERAHLVTAALEAGKKFQNGQTVEYSTVSKGGRGHKAEAAQVAELASVDKKKR